MDRYLRPGIALQRKPLEVPPTRLAEILTVPVGSVCSGYILDKNTVLLMHQQICKFLPKDRQVGARVGYRRPDRVVAGCGAANPYALGSFRIHRDALG